MLLTSESFIVEIPEGLSEFAATTAHTMALAWAACRYEKMCQNESIKTRMVSAEIN